MATEDLKNKLNKQATDSKALTQRSPAAIIAEYIQSRETEIARALPKYMTADRLLRIVLTNFRLTPLLLQCTKESLLSAVLQSAQLGLEPGVCGQSYMIPFKNNKKGIYEVQFIIGYRGMIKLARNSGEIADIYAQEVYENDFFTVKLGVERDLQHIPWDMRTDKQFKEPGKLTFVYMVAKYKDGTYFFAYMNRTKVEAHRKRSRASNDGPWVTDEVEMWKKTIIRANWKWLPISVELMNQVDRADETVKDEIKSDMTEALDVDYTSLEDIGGEVETSETPIQDNQVPVQGSLADEPSFVK